MTQASIRVSLLRHTSSISEISVFDETAIRSKVLAPKASVDVLSLTATLKVGHTLKYICGIYYKNITIVNDTSKVISSNAPSCGIAYNHHSDDSKGVNYVCGEHL
jgi:hypothetical protein